MVALFVKDKPQEDAIDVAAERIMKMLKARGPTGYVEGADETAFEDNSAKKELQERLVLDFQDRAAALVDSDKAPNEPSKGVRTEKREEKSPRDADAFDVLARAHALTD